MLTVSLALPAAEDEKYIFVGDPTFSMITGAENLLTVHRLYRLLDDRYLDRVDQTDGPLGVAARVGKTTFLDLGVTYGLLQLQHEVFGHGARAREFGASSIRYSFSLPFPYGSGHAETRAVVSRRETPLETVARVAGGVEATEHLAGRVALEWMRTGTIDHREALLYLAHFHDQTQNIRGLLGALEIEDRGGDAEAYVIAVNNAHGSATLDMATLRDHALVNFVDPFTYMAAWAIVRYWWTGGDALDAFSLGIGKLSVLPSMRLTLSPFGPEYVARVFVGAADRHALVYVRGGRESAAEYYGVGVELPSWWRSDRWELGVKCDLWRQPGIQSGTGIGQKDSGLLAAAFGRVRVGNRYTFEVTVGAKTEGFVVGEELDRGPILRLGFGVLR